MFNSLSQRLSSVFDRLRGKGVLRAEDVQMALREIRIALLEADVALPVVRSFIEKVQEKAVGQEVIRSLQPVQMVIKIVHDELVALLGEENLELAVASASPYSYLMVGLQGSGKTTSTGKLGLYIKEKLNKKPLLVSLDIYRPAAQRQLEILGQSLNLLTLPIQEGEKPLEIVKRAFPYARQNGVDIILFDTAGRLHIDAELMTELKEVHALTNPLETLFVGDAMMGQDALRAAQAFKEALPITGVILTRLDGDARGGAALSIRSATECPIKFIGVGEKPTQFEPFQADRIARQILDMGDVLGLVEKTLSSIQEEDAEKIMKSAQKGRFDLNDMALQLDQMLKMGGLYGLLNFLPGMGKIKDQLNQVGVDDKVIHRQKAIILSMTPLERKDPKLLNASRKKRIAAGSGQKVPDVNRLLKQFEQMQMTMKKLKNEKALMRGGLGRLFGR